MKISIIGAGGFRTPLIIQSILSRLHKLAIHELYLMDIDAERLCLMGAITSEIEEAYKDKISILRTTDAQLALQNADFIITTFRVGGIESRVIDERIPLNHGILGQETTGPGGFAMGIRSIPVLLEYVKLMQVYCPDAWLINFANPAGMLTEAVIRQTNWSRVVGICDAPSSMHKVISGLLKEKLENVYLDYFGLNHLGWIKRVVCRNMDYLPEMITFCLKTGHIPGLPFSPYFIESLGLIPNEYLYYYYYAHESVNNIIKSGESRGEQITRLNLYLISKFREHFNEKNISEMIVDYDAYLQQRGETYMRAETGMQHDLSILDPETLKSISDEGYAGVALDLIEALTGDRPAIQILNIANRNTISELEERDVVEIPALVTKDHIQPLSVDEIPSHCMGLIRQVKNYEHLTIDAASQGSYKKALLALTIHPLVQDFSLAKTILDEYIIAHKDNFPNLN